MDKLKKNGIQSINSRKTVIQRINSNTLDELRNGNTMAKRNQEKRTGLALKHNNR